MANHLMITVAMNLALLSLSCLSLATGSFELYEEDFSTTAIVIPKSAGNSKQFAAQELQKHLELITGHRFPIVTSGSDSGKVFYVGIRPEFDIQPLENEEALSTVDRVKNGNFEDGFQRLDCAAMAIRRRWT